MLDAVCTLLRGQGVKSIWREVEWGRHRLDLLGLSDTERYVAVEAKRKDVKRAVRQVSRYVPFVSSAYIVIPDGVARESAGRLSSEAGVGVLRCRKDSEGVLEAWEEIPPTGCSEPGSTLGSDVWPGVLDGKPTATETS